MGEEEKNNTGLSGTADKTADDETAVEGREGAEPGKVASARDIPRPSTVLSGRPEKDVGDLVVSLLGDASLIPDLEEIARINEESGREGRTPVMTVIHAVLKKSGGSMKITELAVQARKYWNKPFPTSPYTPEEFIFLLVRSSDDLRVSPR